MKHNWKIIAILLGMFLVTQFIGMYVVNYYSQEGNNLPFGMESPKIEKESEFYSIFPSIIFAFVIAITLLFLLNKFDMAFILKLWFFTVIIIALSISFNSILGRFGYPIFIAIAIALPLAFFKIYKRGFIIHNSTELFIYPGIASVFVPILNVWTIIFLLILISIYDMWAVWKSGIMQKMAKYQIQKLNIFGGFFVPYLPKKTKLKVQKMTKTQLKKKKIKVNLAMLGGGDVIFPIIAAGVFMKAFKENVLFGIGGLGPALFVTAGATLGLSYLFFFSKKEKFYPAMPFITTGIFIGMTLSWLIF